MILILKLKLKVHCLSRVHTFFNLFTQFFISKWFWLFLLRRHLMNKLFISWESFKRPNYQINDFHCFLLRNCIVWGNDWTVLIRRLKQGHLWDFVGDYRFVLRLKSWVGKCKNWVSFIGKQGREVGEVV